MYNSTFESFKEELSTHLRFQAHYNLHTRLKVSFYTNNPYQETGARCFLSIKMCFYFNKNNLSVSSSILQWDEFYL